jgi:hypothetical protein
MTTHIIVVLASVAYLILPFLLRSSQKYKVAGVIIGAGIASIQALSEKGVFLYIQVVLFVCGFVMIRLIAIEPDESER